MALEEYGVIGQSLHLSCCQLPTKRVSRFVHCTSILFYTVAIIKLKYGLISVTCKASYYSFNLGNQSGSVRDPLPVWVSIV